MGAGGPVGPLGPIQVVPPGLTGLLQLKQTGRLPAFLSDLVTPVIELRDWYMTARRITTTQLFPGATPSLSVSAPGVTGFVPGAGGTAIVPPGQYWYVEQLTIRGSLSAAGSTIRFAPCLVSSNLPTEVEVVGPDYNDVVTAAIRQFVAKADRGFWAFPGDTFAAAVLAITTGTAETLKLDLRATVLPI